MKAYFISPLILQSIAWTPTRLLLRMFVRFEIKGLEYLDGARAPFIFAPNHASELDPVLVPAGFDFFSQIGPIFYTSLPKKFYEHLGWHRFFYGGLFFKIWGAFPIKAGYKDYEKALSDHVAIIRDGGSVCIFPEGGMTKDGTIGEGRGGVAYLSHATGAPIVPVGISGTFRLRLVDFFSRKKTISICYGKPMYADELFVTDKFTEVNEEKRVAALVMEEVGNMIRRQAEDSMRGGGIIPQVFVPSSIL